MLWETPNTSDADVERLRSALGVSSPLAALLSRLGLNDPEQASAFLDPRLATLEDPFAITGLREAAARVCEALAQGQRLHILGDYDVDGVTSTVLLVSVLRQLGGQPAFSVPLRKGEGYGISQAALERILEEGRPDLFIALDCGTNAIAEVAYLRQLGVDVMIVDHHKSRSEAVAEAILINPHVLDAETAPWHDLCSVGLTFKLAHGILKLLRAEGDSRALNLDLRQELDLVAIGTVADMVPLRAENRILTRHGLERLGRTTRPGLQALLAAASINPGQPIQPTDVSFRLAPRINASGRLADAALPIQMLLCEDPDRCGEAAERLNALNRERQDIERVLCESAREQIRRASSGEAPGHVLYDPTWHPGVVGIVAGKLAQETQVPCIVLGLDETLAKGSCRSVPGINLVEVLSRCASLLESWGGHPMAAGLALLPENVEAFRQAFEASLREALCSASVQPHALPIAYWVQPAELTESLFEEIERLHPYGQGNPEPLLGIRGVSLVRPPEAFGEGHYRCRLATGRGWSIPGIAWRKAHDMPPSQTPVDIAARLSWNFWQGRRTPQAELIAWRPVSA